MNDIIGRKKEIKQLEKVKNSRKSEFVVVYGRRRVGKTFLVREHFNYTFDFQLTGLANANTKQQLINFQVSLQRQSNLTIDQIPKDWFSAFQLLIDHLESIKEGRKKIVFFDELPWLDTARSDFMMAFEHFWNSWATNRKDILLITCGSAASWMINELINNHGGLHNRVTERLKIYPFNLQETELMLQDKNSVLDRYQILQLYMVMGGVPYYLDMVSSEKSAAQNIEEMCFRKGALLTLEFKNLFTSLFKNAEVYESIIIALSTKLIGMTRNEISQATRIKSGGSLTDKLEALEESGFITRYTSHTLSWKSKESENGAQIDLLIDRRDQVVNLCEIKYSINAYKITKAYAENLRNKIGTFKQETKTRKAIFLTMITTYGVEKNAHSISLVQNNITMDALFE